MFNSERFQKYEHLFGSYAGRFEASKRFKNPMCWVGHTKTSSVVACFNGLMYDEERELAAENAIGVKYRGIVVSENTYDEGIEKISIIDDPTASIYASFNKYYIHIKKTNKDPIVVLEWTHKYDMNKKDNMTALIFANGTYAHTTSNDVADYLQFVWEKLGYRLVELPMSENDILEYDRIRCVDISPALKFAKPIPRSDYFSWS